MAVQVSPLLVIVGETASGKSALALELAKQLNGEIIAADSWTVYRGFDVGTAKPLVAEQAGIRHHLIDVADPVKGFNAVEFQKQAQQAIADITGRGKLPILVGGTGLYIDSVIFEYGFLPPTDQLVRHELDQLSLDEVLERARADGLDLSQVDVRNKRRVIRLIENQGRLPTKEELRPGTLLIGVKIDQDTLRERVEQRVDVMIGAGLEAEVRQLADTYGWDIEPMKGIGYREWKACFEGEQDLETTRQAIVKSTMDLAKRQRTWFKRNDAIHWLAGAEEEDWTYLVNRFIDRINSGKNITSTPANSDKLSNKP